MEPLPRGWSNTETLSATDYTCGHCGGFMSTTSGWRLVSQSKIVARVYICSRCRRPTYFGLGEQVPGPAPGEAVDHLPGDVESLYNEARNCVKVSAYTSSVLACRKLLMNISVEKGAEPGESFVKYIEFLADQNFIPPGSEGWVDHIRKSGNEATHEIEMKTLDDATDLISFSEMLLKFIYEFPARIPST